MEDQIRIDRTNKESSLVDITSEQTSLALYESNEISVVLSRRCNKMPLAYSQIGPKFIISLTQSKPRELMIFDCHTSFQSDPLWASRLLATRLNSVFLECLIPWGPPSMDTLYSIDSPADGSYWMTVFGKVESAYFHAYSTKSGKYLFSAFSSMKSTSLYYLAEIAYHAAKSLKMMTDTSNLAELGQASLSLATIPQMPVTGLWRLAEAWSLKDPELAVQLLELVRLRGGGLGDKAAHTLASFQK
jgi:hypothetical protein